MYLHLHLLCLLYYIEWSSYSDKAFFGNLLWFNWICMILQIGCCLHAFLDTLNLDPCLLWTAVSFWSFIVFVALNPSRKKMWFRSFSKCSLMNKQKIRCWTYWKYAIQKRKWIRIVICKSPIFSFAFKCPRVDLCSFSCLISIFAWKLTLVFIYFLKHIYINNNLNLSQ